MVSLSFGRIACGLLLLATAMDLTAAPPRQPVVPPTGPILVGTTAVETTPYEQIIALSEGPMSWFEPDETKAIQARAYRVVVTSTGTYNRVYIETVTFGAEGCCTKLTRIMQFDLEAFADTLGFRGDKSGFQFEQWLSEASFLFQYRDREFLVSRLDRDDVLVTPYAGH